MLSHQCKAHGKHADPEHRALNWKSCPQMGSDRNRDPILFYHATGSFSGSEFRCASVCGLEWIISLHWVWVYLHLLSNAATASMMPEIQRMSHGHTYAALSLIREMLLWIRVSHLCESIRQACSSKRQNTTKGVPTCYCNDTTQYTEVIVGGFKHSTVIVQPKHCVVLYLPTSNI